MHFKYFFRQIFQLKIHKVHAAIFILIVYTDFGTN